MGFDTLPDHVFDEDCESKFFHILFNGNREAAKREILILLDRLGDRESLMIDIMSKIVSSGEE
ncbi:MAG: hypothetical protein LBE89_06005 [Helicobacteraceae bacterium]|nr:hypothetical protein [Helicobacteraceae bacterium]